MCSLSPLLCLCWGTLSMGEHRLKSWTRQICFPRVLVAYLAPVSVTAAVCWRSASRQLTHFPRSLRQTESNAPHPLQWIPAEYQNCLCCVLGGKVWQLDHCRLPCRSQRLWEGWSYCLLAWKSLTSELLWCCLKQTFIWICKMNSNRHLNETAEWPEKDVWMRWKKEKDVWVSKMEQTNSWQNELKQTSDWLSQLTGRGNPVHQKNELKWATNSFSKAWQNLRVGAQTRRTWVPN